MGRLRGSLVGCAFLFASLSAAGEDAARSSSDVRVQNIEVRLSQAGPVVLLKVRNKAIPVFVDALVAGKTTRVFDSRSSDAIALAIRFKAPILVGEELLDSVGVDLPEPGVKEL